MNVEGEGNLEAGIKLTSSNQTKTSAPALGLEDTLHTIGLNRTLPYQNLDVSYPENVIIHDLGMVIVYKLGPYTQPISYPINPCIIFQIVH